MGFSNRTFKWYKRNIILGLKYIFGDKISVFALTQISGGYSTGSTDGANSLPNSPSDNNSKSTNVTTNESNNESNNL